jgi:hypothetical protein
MSAGIYNWPAPGCAGLWHFADDGVDSSVNANNGTASDGVAYALGKFGKCANLTANYFTLVYAASLKVANLTISAWYRGTSVDNPGTILACSGVYIGSPGIHYGYILQTQSGKASLRLMDSVLTGNIAINDGLWHWIAATRDDAYARVYVDGYLDAEAANPLSMTYCTHAPASYRWAGAYIGAAYRMMVAPSTIGNLPTCYLDELQLLDYALSPSDIRRLYAFQMGRLN